MGTDTEHQPKQSAKEIISKHGPSGAITRALYRFRILGWILFFILLGYLFFAHIISISIHKPILAVNEKGQIVGQLEFFDKAARGPNDFMYAGMRYIECRYTYNSDRIWKDLECATALMSPRLLATEKKRFATDPIFAKIEKAKTSSSIQWNFNEADGTYVVESAPGFSTIRYRGTIKIRSTNHSETPVKFDLELKMVSTPRNKKNTHGVYINEVSEL